MWPEDFQSFNLSYIQEIMKLVSKKSAALEKQFEFVVRLILYRINDKYAFKDESKMYNYFNVAKAMADIKETDGEVKQNGRFQKFIHTEILIMARSQRFSHFFV